MIPGINSGELFRQRDYDLTDLVVQLLLCGPALQRLGLAVEQHPVTADLHVFLVRVVKLNTLCHCLGGHLLNHTYIIISSLPHAMLQLSATAPKGLWLDYLSSRHETLQMIKQEGNARCLRGLTFLFSSHPAEGGDSIM